MTYQTVACVEDKYDGGGGGREESADGQRILCLENMAETISLSLDRNTLYDLLEENLYVIIPPRDHCIYVDFKKIGSNRPNKSLVRLFVCSRNGYVCFV